MIQSRRLDIHRERYPYACQWEITCRCNLRCVMCYTDCFNTPEKIREELTTSEVLRILNELREAGCLEVAFTGGEPLARPDFKSIYEHAKLKGFIVTILTNATLIDEKIADWLAVFPPERVEISFHGLSQESFDRITQGPGSFARCKQAIALLAERNIPLLLKTQAMTINREEILEIKKWIQTLPNTRYRLGDRIRVALDGGVGPKQFQVSDEILEKIFENDTELQKDACNKREESGNPCISGNTTFHIDAYGMLQLCSGNRRKGYDLRQGPFLEGFYRHLPQFPCAYKPQFQGPHDNR
jgi:molybdenum cofactor biosynthesis enzyme MoaA